VPGSSRQHLGQNGLELVAKGGGLLFGFIEFG
jgi:hypothetical protein